MSWADVCRLLLPWCAGWHNASHLEVEGIATVAGGDDDGLSCKLSQGFQYGAAELLQCGDALCGDGVVYAVGGGNGRALEFFHRKVFGEHLWCAGVLLSCFHSCDVFVCTFFSGGGFWCVHWMASVIAVPRFRALRMRSAKGLNALRGWMRHPPALERVPRMMLPSVRWCTPFPPLSMGHWQGMGVFRLTYFSCRHWLQSGVWPAVGDAGRMMGMWRPYCLQWWRQMR